MILLVDDDDVLLDLAKAYLTKSGFEVESQTSAFGLVNRAAGREGIRPDLIILDHMMPALDGGTAARLLAGDEAARDVPVIFFTAADPATLAALENGHPKARAIQKGSLKNLLAAVEEMLAASKDAR